MQSDMGGDVLRQGHTPQGLGAGGPDVTGWMAFAVAMLTLSGILSGLWGLLALVRRAVIIPNEEANPIDLDFRLWGWIHIALGLGVLVIAWLLPRGAPIVRTLAVVAAALSFIGNLLVIASYPVWSAFVMGVDLLVIFAVTVHGHEVQPTQRRPPPQRIRT